MPSYREVDVKSATRTSGAVDAWFLARWGVNLYRGCEHACAYCDGRAEKYRVEGSFENDIVIKRNIAAVFAEEMKRIREPGFVFLGGGVCDAYQPAEATYRLARSVLEVVRERGLAVHALTKSALIERDFDLLSEINQRTRAIVSFSINTVDDEVRQRFEPGASRIEERWRVLAEAKRRGFGVGVMAVPVLPGISDQPDQIDALAAKAAQVGVDFLSLGGLTLRPGVQKQTMLARVQEHYPDIVAGYEQVFRDNRASGAADGRYYAKLDARFRASLRKHGLPGRVPHRLFQGLLPLYAEVAVLLEHLEFEATLHGGRRSDLARSGIAIQDWARSRLSRNARMKGYDSTSVDQELRARATDGTLLQVPGVVASSLPVIREMCRA